MEKQNLIKIIQKQNRKLFQIQDNDRPCYVIATDYEDAVIKWKKIIAKENGHDNYQDIVEPLGIAFLAEQEEEFTELIL